MMPAHETTDTLSWQPPEFAAGRRRRLSRHYPSKSRSFSQLSEALTTEYGESAQALGKKRSALEELDGIAEETTAALRRLTLSIKQRSTDTTIPERQASAPAKMETTITVQAPFRRVRPRIDELPTTEAPPKHKPDRLQEQDVLEKEM